VEKSINNYALLGGYDMARPIKEINEEEVFKLAQIGATSEEMGHFFGCTAQTIMNRFRDTIEAGHSEAKMSIRRKRLQIAMNDDHKQQASMLMFLSKVWLGEKEYAVVDAHNGPAPIQIEFIS